MNDSIVVSSPAFVYSLIRDKDKRSTKVYSNDLSADRVTNSPERTSQRDFFVSIICKRLKKTTEGFLKSSTYFR